MAFYKRDGDELHIAPLFVASPTYELLADRHTEYDYPVDGWYWAEGDELAALEAEADNGEG